MENIETLYPLSPMQQGMLFHSLYSPHSGMYFNQLSFTLEGKLNSTAFQQAWQYVLERHAALRTAFHWKELEEPMQVVYKQVELPWKQLDWRNLSSTEQENKLEGFLEADYAIDFTLEQVPLMRCTLIQLTDNSYHFVWTHHHLVIDGWCLPIIFKEVFAYYEGITQGITLQLAPPRSYQNYIVWLQEQDMAKAEQFWQEQLKGFIAPTTLNLEKTRTDQEVFQVKETLHLSATTTQALQTLARQHNLTLNILLQGAWALLLSRYSGEDDVVFGVTVSGRQMPLPGVESMVGLFINTLPVRIRLSGEESLIPWLQQLQAQQLERDPYSYTPLVEIHRWSEIPPGTPLFESIFVFENYPLDDALLNSNNQLTLSNFQHLEKTNYPIGIMAIPGKALSLTLIYEPCRFETSFIERMLGHLQTLLEAMVADPAQRLMALEMLTENERHQLLVEWNQTQTPYPQEQCIHQLFEAQVDKTPEAIAVVFEDQQLTYQALNTRANLLAHFLQGLGVGEEVLVGLCVERSLEMIIGLLAILKAGGAYVPFDPNYPQKRLEFILEDSQVLLLLTQQKLMAQLPDSKAQVICLDNGCGMISKSALENINTNVSSDNLAYVIYTSGSTGQPKGALVEHLGLTNLVKEQIKLFNVQANSRILQFVSFSFDVATSDIFAALCSGATLCLAPNDSFLHLSKLNLLLREQGITHLQLPSSILAILPFEQIPIQNLIIGGEICSQDLAAQWAQGRHFFNAYGPTEATVCATIFEYTQARATLPIGRPIANTQLYILDKQLHPVPIAVSGELYIGGIGLARGYLNRPDLTAEKFIPNPFGEIGSRLYKTGDLARYLPDGNIEFLGRIDNQVKLRGFRIELGEIESVLTQHPNIRESVVIAREDQPGNKRLVAYLVSDLIPKRIPYQVDCLLKRPDSEILKLRTEDISSGGVLLGGTVSLEKDQAISLRFKLQGESDAIWLNGKIAWSRPPWAGIQFQLTSTEQTQLENSIVYLLEKQGLLKVLQRILTENLRNYLQDKLPDYMVPVNFVLLNAFPLTPNGKIDRRALPVPEIAYLAKEASLPQNQLEQMMVVFWQELLHLDKVGIHDNFFELGGNSLLLPQLQSKLQHKLGKEISMVDLFEYPTIHSLAQHLIQSHQCVPTPLEEQTLSPTRQAEHDIALIGLAGRFPGAPNLETFWQNLQEGRESITFFSDEELLSAGIDSATLNHPHYVKANGMLSEVESFDATFFDFSPKEAEVTDPQHRLFLECAVEALENAGIAQDNDKSSVGVYAGVSMNTYLFNNLSQHFDSLSESVGTYQLLIENDKDFLPTRTSYKLNLTGPSVNIQTACSTSLVAVHLACRSLQDSECHVALAGGVAIHVPQKAGYWYQEGMINSPDGHCRAFDAEAQGTVVGNGVGIVVLKRLEEAIADGDNIHAVIKGSAINNDGALKVGYTAPSVDGQAAVIAEAQAKAGLEAESISYIEAHGTGTPLGDPIEIAALTKAFEASTHKKGFCAIGSVKTNIGHTDAAAGVAGLIKTVLALKHQLLPPSLHFKKPNPQIDFANTPFYVNTTLSAWETLEGMPRRAGVSSFGIGGTNAHVILEEAPPLESSGDSRPWQLLVISAKSESALEKKTADLADYLAQHPEQQLADVAYTLSTGRKVFQYRRMLVCQTTEQASRALRNIEASCVLSHFQVPQNRPIVFMFSGQGAQYVNMGWELYQTEPVFQEEVDKCSVYLKQFLGRDLRLILYPKGDFETPERSISEEDATALLNQTAIAQPALFVIEYALAQLWMAWGLQPDAMIGHSIGEYVAACLAKVFSLEEALSLVALRGKMMQEMPRGAMLSISLSEKAVQPFLTHDISLAAVNTDSVCVLSGPNEKIALLETQLIEEGVACRSLHTSHAFHSDMMTPLLSKFSEQVKQVDLCVPKIPYVSNLTGTWITEKEATNPKYWEKHLRYTVRFAEGLTHLLEDPARLLLEVGPGRTLTTFVKQHPNYKSEQVVLSSLRHPEQDKLSDVAFLLKSLGQFWLAGGEINWTKFYKPERRRRLALPTYPFARQRYWIEPRKEAVQTKVTFNKLLNIEQAELFNKITAISSRKQPDTADWFYFPSWKQKRLSAPIMPSEKTIVLFHDETLVFSQKLIERLEKHSLNVISVTIGTSFTQLSENHYTLNPKQANDYDALVKALHTRDKALKTLVHFWTVTPEYSPLRLESLEAVQTLAFYSLFFLAQAIGKENVIDPLELIVVSNRIQQVTGEEMQLSPEKATVFGLVRVIPTEYPNIRCRHLDIALPESESPLEEILLTQLQQEFLTASEDRIIAYRGHHRWVQTFEPFRLEGGEKKIPQLREGGVYLITGGLGGIGLVLAENLAKTVAAKLILIGRTVFPKRDDWAQWLATHETTDPISIKIQNIQALEQFGAEVLILNADVTDLSRMRTVITQSAERFGTIHGVIHAAGISPGGTIQRKTPEQADMILAPKVLGTVVLDAVLKAYNLDFFVLCSSLASMMGNIGSVDHSAANSFIDAFAHYKTTQSAQFTVSINWDGWQEVGQAAEAAKQEYDGKSLLSQTSQSHPLFQQCLIMGTEEHYITYDPEKHWLWDEHRILGEATLPGTGYLEMAKAAFEENHPNLGTLEIREVYFLTPLSIKENENIEVRTILKPQAEGEGFEFVIVSQSDSNTAEWKEHAKGQLISRERKTPPTQYNLQELEAKCRENEMIITEADFENSERFVKVGPRWHNLKWIKFGPEQGLALLELPTAYRTDLHTFTLHPALLDSATGFAGAKNEGDYLPFSYKKLLISGPLPAKIYSYITSDADNSSKTDTPKFNIILMDEEGRGLVEIEDYTLRRIAVEKLEKPLAHEQSVAENFELEIVSPGLLESLSFRRATRQPPGPGEVEIEVYTTAINFKEVLIALGMISVPTDISVKFGYECAGKIVAIGEGVESFQIGDPVIAFANNGFAAFTTTLASSVILKPDFLSFEEAATIPVAFGTAYYALIQLARLAKGERILIHAAAGGVGMAAVKIAQWIGAEIFATAGNPEKRAFLRSLGINNVMDSRTLDFASEVMAYTDGKGVDVVLNSLGGEFISKSFETLAPFGRFVELGVRDIYNNTQLGLRPFERGLAYFAVGAGQSIPHFEALFKEVVQHFKAEHFTPLAHQVFPISEVPQAFEYMAKAKHIGKVVVSLQEKDAVFKQLSEGTALETAIRPISASVNLPNKPEPVKNIFYKNLSDYLLPAEGAEVFKRILGSTVPQVLVSTRDLHARLQENQAETFLSEMKADEQPIKTAHPRPQLGQAYMPPRNALEEKLAKLWQTFMGIEQVGIHDDFFELGGDSLLAIQLIAQVGKTLGIELSPHSLLNSPTIATLAKSLKDTLPKNFEQTQDALSPLLVEIQTGSRLKAPLFLMHPVGGHVYFYRNLANLIGRQQPIYGLQARGVDGKTDPLTQVEEMATLYIDALRVLQPQGPYFLGGSSFGGVLAFEMAQQLHALGEQIALLAMIDTPILDQMPVKLEKDVEILAYMLQVGGNVPVSLEELQKLEADEQIRYFFEEQGKIENQMLFDLDINQLRHFFKMFKVNSQAMWDYQPRIYPGKITFFSAQEKDAYNAKRPEQAWQLLANEIEVIDVPGNHITMNALPHVQVIADYLKTVL
jgi:amino acid adenylation domain-containing protein